MLQILRSILPEDSWIRLAYSWFKAIIARLRYGNPSKDLLVIGITGTDGKTTTTHFSAQLLEELGFKVAMSSSEEIWMAGERRDNTTKRTTLSPFVVQDFLKEAREKSCDIVILEVSSHALVQGRVFGVDFDGAIITNISQEHGNYHKDLHEYAEVKSRLFHMVLNSKKQREKIFLVNKDMEFFDLFASIDPSVTQTYGIGCKECEISAEGVEIFSKKSNFQLVQNGKKYSTELNIPGLYNIENVMAAVLLAEYCGFSLEEIAKKIPLLHSVNGRLEEVEVPREYKVYIDFALTPGALEKLLLYAQAVTEGKVWLVFGCTGANHDHAKRPLMGEIASKYADYAIVTEDETYGEDNKKIMKEIESGFDLEFSQYQKIDEREDAIYYALEHAKKGDTILITGMGAFNSRNNGKEEIPWNDKGCVLSYFTV